MGLTARIQVLFEPGQAARLQAIAEAEGRSVGALIGEAVERTYLERDRWSDSRRSAAWPR
jgi:predicted transcriptional regulator